MKVKLIFEGADCALVVEPTDDQDKALLAAFGIKGQIEANAIVNRDPFGKTECLRVVVRQVPKHIVERASA